MLWTLLLIAAVSAFPYPGDKDVKKAVEEEPTSSPQEKHPMLKREENGIIKDAGDYESLTVRKREDESEDDDDDEEQSLRKRETGGNEEDDDNDDPQIFLKREVESEEDDDDEDGEKLRKRGVVTRHDDGGEDRGQSAGLSLAQRMGLRMRKRALEMLDAVEKRAEAELRKRTLRLRRSPHPTHVPIHI